MYASFLNLECFLISLALMKAWPHDELWYTNCGVHHSVMDDEEGMPEVSIAMEETESLEENKLVHVQAQEANSIEVAGCEADQSCL